MDGWHFVISLRNLTREKYDTKLIKKKITLWSNICLFLFLRRLDSIVSNICISEEEDEEEGEKEEEEEVEGGK